MLSYSITIIFFFKVLVIIYIYQALMWFNSDFHYYYYYFYLHFSSFFTIRNLKIHGKDHCVLITALIDTKPLLFLKYWKMKDSPEWKTQVSLLMWSTIKSKLFKAIATFNREHSLARLWEGGDKWAFQLASFKCFVYPDINLPS